MGRIVRKEILTVIMRHKNTISGAFLVSCSFFVTLKGFFPPWIGHARVGVTETFIRQVQNESRVLKG